MTTQQASEPITSAQAKALRNADSIVFHHREGVGYIRAIQRAEKSTTGFEQEVRIDARMSTITDYHQPEDRDGNKYDAAVVWTSPQYGDIARTIIRALRTGREFNLQWVRNNSNLNLDKIGWVRDELRIQVGNEKSADSFLVDVYVGPDNSARMVRYGSLF